MIKKEIYLSLMILSTTCSAAEKWDGFYVGMNADYNLSTSALKTRSNVAQYCATEDCEGSIETASAAAAGATQTLSLKRYGPRGSAQAGYNKAISARYLIGVEADLQPRGKYQAGAADTGSYFTVGGVFQPILSNLKVFKSVENLSSVRGKIGYFLNPTLVMAGVAGFSYGDAHFKTNISQQYGVPADGVALNWDTTGSYSKTRLGWTLGANLEKRLPGNWSIKSEYLYYDLGKVTYKNPDLSDIIIGDHTPQYFLINNLNTTTRFNDHKIRVGLNYHLR